MLTLTIILLGTLTVSLSLFAEKEFLRRADELSGRAGSLSRAISWQLWGESVIGAGTLLFAAAAHFDFLNTWSPEFQNLLRLMMFSATSLTTLHLCLVIRKIKKA